MMDMYTAMLVTVGLMSIAAGQGLNDQIDNADRQLMAITARMVSLKNDLDSRLATGSDEEAKVGRLTDLIDSRYGTGCEERKFRCGNTVRCISSLLVCDGSTDCPNGEDETDALCEFPLPVGSKMVGRKLWDTCMTSLESNRTEEYWIVTDVKRVDYFTPIATVRWEWYTSAETTEGSMVTTFYGNDMFTLYNRVLHSGPPSSIIRSGCTVDKFNPKFIRCRAYRLGDRDDTGRGCHEAVWYIVN